MQSHRLGHMPLRMSAEGLPCSVLAAVISVEETDDYYLLPSLAGTSSFDLIGTVRRSNSDVHGCSFTVYAILFIQRIKIHNVMHFDGPIIICIHASTLSQ